MSTLPFWWIMARASGVVGYLLITASMVAGVVLRSRLMQKAVSPIGRMEWHKVLAMLGLALVALHGLALVMDTYMPISPIDLVVPGGIEYRPLWTAFGVLAMWLMVGVSVTAAMRKHLSARMWKGIHMASYGVFVTATIHGVLAGTDSGRPWMLGIYLGSTALVVAVASRRFLVGPNAPLRRARRRAPAQQVVAPVPAEQQATADHVGAMGR